MHLVLETGDGSVAIDNECGGHQGIIDDALGAEHNGNAGLRGDGRNDGPCAFEERTVGRRHAFPRRAVARNEALRKTDEAGALDRCLVDGLLGQRDRVLGRRREPDIGERDSKSSHGGRPNSSPKPVLGLPRTRRRRARPIPDFQDRDHGPLYTIDFITRHPLNDPVPAAGAVDIVVTQHPVEDEAPAMVLRVDGEALPIVTRLHGKRSVAATVTLGELDRIASAGSVVDRTFDTELEFGAGQVKMLRATADRSAWPRPLDGARADDDGKRGDRVGAVEQRRLRGRGHGRSARPARAAPGRSRRPEEQDDRGRRHEKSGSSYFSEMGSMPIRCAS